TLMPAVVTMPRQPIRPLAIRIGANEDSPAIRQVGAEQELSGIIQASRVHGVRRKTDDRGAGECITDGNDLVRDWIGSLEESAATGFQVRTENDRAAVVDAHLAAAEDLAVGARRIYKRRERAVPGLQEDLAAGSQVRGNGY